MTDERAQIRATGATSAHVGMTEAEQERARVVAWLRDPGTVMGLRAPYNAHRKDGQPTAGTQQNRGVAFMFMMDAADAIEAGDHLKGVE